MDTGGALAKADRVVRTPALFIKHHPPPKKPGHGRPTAEAPALLYDKPGGRKRHMAAYLCEYVRRCPLFTATIHKKGGAYGLTIGVATHCDPIVAIPQH